MKCLHVLDCSAGQAAQLLRLAADFNLAARLVAGDQVVPAPSRADRPEVTYGGATAMARGSAPLRFWRRQGLLAKQLQILDFGCGQEAGHSFAKYDPFHHPDPGPLLQQWDRVLCTYVLNVQPAEHLVVQIAALVRQLLRPEGRALFAVRLDLAGDQDSHRGHQLDRTPAQWQTLLAPFFQLEVRHQSHWLGLVGQPLTPAP